MQKGGQYRREGPFCIILPFYNGPRCISSVPSIMPSFCIIPPFYDVFPSASSLPLIMSSCCFLPPFYNALLLHHPPILYCPPFCIHPSHLYCPPVCIISPFYIVLPSASSFHSIMASFVYHSSCLYYPPPASSLPSMFSSLTHHTSLL